MLNEFRQDLVSGDWVLFVTDRAKGHVKTKKEKFYQPKEGCPFEDLKASGNSDPVLVYHKGNRADLNDFNNGNWTTLVIPNKFPAVKAGICLPPSDFGPFKRADAVGFHELVITKEHDKGLCGFNEDEIAEILTVYRERYLEIYKDDCGQYILIFHNKGPTAGASVYHNHSQILSTPVLPPDIWRSVKGSEEFYQKNKKKVHDVMLEWEMKENKRIIYDNKDFVAFCPYVSKSPFEIRIFPKESKPRFEVTGDAQLKTLASVLSAVFGKLDKALEEPDFNFYIHTAPVKHNHESDYYHWHIEIVPRVKILGGMELGTDLYVNEIDPDVAAKLLRDANSQ